MKKDLIKIPDLTKEEILAIVEQAFEYKRNGTTDKPLTNKVVAMVFEKPSLRTKVAFEVAANKLGATPVFLSSPQIFASGNYEKGRESIPDIAKNLERFSDLILARVYDTETLATISENIAKPVINALCNKYHPTQALADLMAIIWHKGDYQNLKVCFIGDGNNVATSLMHICATMGIEFSIASPTTHQIPQTQQALALQKSDKLHFHEHPLEAIQDADVVYTDTFVSMGEEDQKLAKLKAFENYQVTKKLLKQAKPEAIFMHCLPAHRGEEVTDEVMDCKQSIVFDQAECRMHIAQALLKKFLHKA